MSSVIADFNYDIFISYRQKDNKYDGWVTEFVDNLKKELEATFKEEITLYFDINPHDGLLETHDVDDSLKEKLKCLIFIPIISRTYCDPKSFAWEHEFKAFLEMASRDKFGQKVKLPIGNVASRVLPVRIHEVDDNDIKLCESISGGALRGIDFIYKSAGVNRPLRSNEDHPRDNLNRTYYRDQINKVANAIEEIIKGIIITQKNIPEASEHNRQVAYELPGIKKVRPPVINMAKVRKAALSIFLLAVALSIILNKPAIFNGSSRQKRQAAMTHIQTALQYFENEDYDLAEKETSLALQDDPEYSYAWSTLAAISVKKGDLNSAVVQTLEAIKFDQENHEAAYNLAFALEDKKDFRQAAEWYSRSIWIDSAFVPAYSALARMYNNQSQPVDAILLLSKAKEKFPSSQYNYLIYKNLGNAYLLQDLSDSAKKYLELSLKIKPDEAETSLFLARAYEFSGEFNKSIEAWQQYIKYENDTVKIREAEIHLKKIAIEHLKQIIE